MKLAAFIVSVLLAGCVTPDEFSPPRTEACQIWVRIDDGPWRCYERGKVLRDLCKATACSP